MKQQFFISFFVLLALYSKAQKPQYSISGFAQGTTYHILYYDSLARDFSKEVSTILEKFDLSVSTYNSQSIISQINNNEKNVVLDNYFVTCFNKAKEVWISTNGAFDPTVFPLVNAWGFGPNKAQYLDKPNKQKQIIDSVLKFVGLQLISIKKNKIKKKDPRVSLDFNAFAQGYSVDVVSDFLTSKGLTSFIVEIGGEVYAKGKMPNNNNWTVAIEQPFDNKENENPTQATIKLESRGVATSGDYRRYQLIDGVKYAHHIDPKTGYPTKNNLLSASLFTNDCISADANATGILVMGLEKAKVFLSQHPEIQAYLIYSDENGNFKTYETEGLKTIIIETKD